MLVARKTLPNLSSCVKFWTDSQAVHKWITHPELRVAGLVKRRVDKILLASSPRRRRLAGHLFQDRWKDQGRGFILLPPWPPNCLGQMLTVRDFSQHLVSSSTTIRPNIPRGARCMGHCEMM